MRAVDYQVVGDWSLGSSGCSPTALEASRCIDSGDSLKRRRMNTIVREIVREVIRVALPPLTKAVTKAVEAVFQRQPSARRGPVVVSSSSPVSDDASVPDARLVDQLRKLSSAVSIHLRTSAIASRSRSGDGSQGLRRTGRCRELRSEPPRVRCPCRTCSRTNAPCTARRTPPSSATIRSSTDCGYR